MGEKKEPAMRKGDLVREIASRLNGATHKQIKAFLQATQDVVEDTITEKKRIKLFDFMYISGVEKEASIKRNVHDNCAIEVPAHTIPKAEFNRAFRYKLRGVKK